MKKLSFILCSLVLVFGLLLFIKGYASERQQKEDYVMKEKTYNNQLSKAEKQRQEKELEEFLEKENKPNALLPMPNPDEKLSFNGMPLPDGEKIEPKNIN